jgi:lipid II:glycine glycyltransferase (peptidoglycan interpeptide bridge formation enzyme)
MAVDGARDFAISTVDARADWDPLFARAPFPHLPQSWMYGEGKRGDGWTIERLAIHSPHGPLALAQVLVKNFAGFPMARINRGPVFLDSNPSPETRAATLRALRRRWRFLRRGVLLIAPALAAGEESARDLRAAGFMRRGAFAWGSALIDLSPPVDDIHKKLSSEWRTKVRKAGKNGVTLAVRTDAEAFEWMLEKHVENMRAKDFVGPSADFVRRVIEAGRGDFFLLQALIDGEPHAATLIARFGQHAENFIGWFDDAARRAAAGNFLMWNSVVEMKRIGCRALDLGGFSVADRYGQFKRGMRGDEYQLAGEWLAF